MTAPQPATPLTMAQRRELRSISATGEPSDLHSWHAAGSLCFVARDRVLGALLRKGLIADDGGFSLTDAGRSILRELGEL